MNRRVKRKPRSLLIAFIITSNRPLWWYAYQHNTSPRGVKRENVRFLWMEIIATNKTCLMKRKPFSQKWNIYVFLILIELRLHTSCVPCMYTHYVLLLKTVIVHYFILLDLLKTSLNSVAIFLNNYHRNYLKYYVLVLIKRARMCVCVCL